MKFVRILSAVAISTSGLLAIVSSTSAQTTQLALFGSKITKGVFKSSLGIQGSFQRTIQTSDGPSLPGYVATPGGTITDTIVYTRNSDGLTRTSSKTSYEYPDGSHTVTMSSTDWGATTPYTAQITLTSMKGNQFVGHGTYTTAQGDTGTLTTLETNDGRVSIVTSLRNSQTTGITQILDTEKDNGDGSSVNKEVLLTPGDLPGSVVIRRFDTVENE